MHPFIDIDASAPRSAEATPAFMAPRLMQKLKSVDIVVAYWTTEHVGSLLSLAANVEPPASAEFLLEFFVTSERGQALVGDLRERVARDCAELGRARAERRCWGSLRAHLAALARRPIGRAIKWGVFVDAFWHHWHG